jgi:hypothetical protein
VQGMRHGLCEHGCRKGRCKECGTRLCAQKSKRREFVPCRSMRVVVGARPERGEAGVCVGQSGSGTTGKGPVAPGECACVLLRALRRSMCTSETGERQGL